jgi:hypothetical protein
MIRDDIRPIHEGMALTSERLSLAGLVATVVLGAFTRLGWLGAVEFQNDESWALTAASSIARGQGLPPVGIGSSLDVPNAPLFVYLMALPELISRDPAVATALIGLLGVAAVAATFGLAAYLFDPVAGASAALLYAVSPWGIIYSRKIWGQDALPLFVTLGFWALFAGLLSGRRFWIAPGVLLLALATQLHPTAFFLSVPALVLVAGCLALDWPWIGRTLCWLALGLGAGIAAEAPFLIWQARNQWPILRAAGILAGGPATVDLATVRLAASVVAGNGYPTLAEVDNPWRPAGYVVAALFIVGIGAISAGVLRVADVGESLEHERTSGRPRLPPAVLPWRFNTRTSGPSSMGPSHPSPLPGGGVTGRSLGLNASLVGPAPSRTHWQITGVVLLAWLAAPVLLQIRHSVPLFPHYFIVLYPAPFLVMGAAVAAFWRWSRVPSAGFVAPNPRHHLMRGIIVAAVALPVVLGLAAFRDYVAAVDRGDVRPSSGVPLDRQKALFAEIDGLAEGGAVDFGSHDSLAATMAYFSDGHWRIYDDRDGLLVPMSDRPSVVAIADPSSHAGSLAARWLGAGRLATLQPTYWSSVAIYRVRPGGAEEDAGYHALSVTFDDGMTLAGYRVASDPAQRQLLIDLHWRADRTPSPKPPTVFNHLLGPSGDTVARVDGLAYDRVDWNVGDVLLDEFVMPWPAAAGPYQLEVGLYDYPSIHRFQIIAPAPGTSADAVVLGPVTLDGEATS